VENLPVIIRRRDTGALVQRSVFPTRIAGILFKIDSRGALLAAARSLWGLGPKEQGFAATSALAR
jgi:cellulose synthase operon protein C